MRMSGATAALVALEDKSPYEIFTSLSGTSIPLWPLLRWPLASALSHTEYDTSPAPRSERATSKVARFARTALPSRRWSRALRRPTPVLFAGPGGRNIPSPAGIVNPLLGPFAELVGEDAAMLQYEPIRPDRTYGFEPTASFEDAIVASEVRARIAPPSAGTLRAAREFAEAIIGHLEHPLDTARRVEVFRTFESRVRRVSSLADSYARLLDRLRPHLLILHQAAYGDRSVFVSAAHERRIHVAEPQHGWLGSSHGAYNFGAAAYDPRLRATLPDTLLTFGDFWSESITAPFATVAIGKPTLEDARAQATPVADRPKELLYVSTVVDPEGVARFVLRLRDVVPAGWTVVFRPHPKERDMFGGRYPSLVDAPGLRLDDEPDPYRSFARSRVVVGATSTALYEVMALGTPTVLQVSKLTPFYMDPQIFTNRVEPDDDPQPAIRRAIESPELDLPAGLVERVWATGSRERFRQWADQILDSSARGSRKQ
jgi:hypothetical protein